MEAFLVWLVALEALLGCPEGPVDVWWWSWAMVSLYGWPVLDLQLALPIDRTYRLEGWRLEGWTWRLEGWRLEGWSPEGLRLEGMTYRLEGMRLEDRT